jgi:hypothetical protein
MLLLVLVLKKDDDVGNNLSGSGGVNPLTCCNSSTSVRRTSAATRVADESLSHIIFYFSEIDNSKEWTKLNFFFPRSTAVLGPLVLVVYYRLFVLVAMGCMNEMMC